jgi:hypothetical protein
MNQEITNANNEFAQLVYEEFSESEITSEEREKLRTLVNNILQDL